MRLSLTFVASVLAATGLVGANRKPIFLPFPSTQPVVHAKLIASRSPAVEIRAGHHTIEKPAAGASIKSPFTFKFSDTVSLLPPLPSAARCETSTDKRVLVLSCNWF